MPPVLLWLLGFILILFVVGIVLVARRRERERTEELRRVAETAGLSFEEKSELAALRAFGDSALFDRGHSKRVKNLMKGSIGDDQVLVFDYQYTTGSGKHQNTTTQTVVMLPGAKGSLPDLQMTPENVFTRIGEKFGYQDIDFDSNPEFSRKYVVKGPDEAAIRAALYPGATAYFEQHEGWTVEVRSATVVIYRAGKRPKADEMRPFIEDARAAVRAL